MPFDIVNDPADVAAQRSKIDSTDLDAMVAGFAGTGVSTGGAVTASSTTVLAVASGTGTLAGVPFSWSSATPTVTAADGTNPRRDIVTVSSAGVVTVTAGTATATPVEPAIPANSVLLAVVEVLAAATDRTAWISDRRVMIGALPAHASSHAPGGTDRLYLDGGRRLATSFVPLLPEQAVADYPVASGRMLFVVGRAQSSFTATQMVCVTGTTVSSAITLARMGIYTVASDLAVTLVASTVNDTALTATVSSVRAKALSATYDIVAGEYYALGVLQVATIPGSLRSARTNQAMSDAGFSTFWAPLGRSLASQTDLPSSVAAGGAWEAATQVAGAVFLAAAT